MSGKKQVIHVKDLVIKADNVFLDTPPRRRPARHPFFGFSGEGREKEIESSSYSLDLDSKDEKDEDDDSDDRKPFSWI